MAQNKAYTALFGVSTLQFNILYASAMGNPVYKLELGDPTKSPHN
jgi:hypothetical protein